ncbi:6871_t:CDS:2, partial [Dentiscutata heterogama]
NSDPTKGFLRFFQLSNSGLSEIGTSYFNNITNITEKNLNISTLNTELVQCISINFSRLNFSGRYDIDSTTPNNQFLLELTIYTVNNSSEPNVTKIMKDLNTLIKYKSITCISNLALDIDEIYYFTPRSNLFDEIKYYVEFSPAQRGPHKLKCSSDLNCYYLQKHEYNENFLQDNCSEIIFFTSILSIIRLIANILFVIYEVKNVRNLDLYVP